MARFLKLNSIIVIATIGTIVQLNPVAIAQSDRFKNIMCGVNPSRTMFRTAKRDEVALFFQNHFPKKQIVLIDFLATYKTKTARSAEVKDALDTNVLYHRSLQEIVTTIGDLFIQKKLSWLGVEKESDEVGLENETENETALAKAAADIELQLKKDKLKPADIKSFLILQMGPVGYARWKNQALKNSSRVVALDNLAIRMRVNGYTDKLRERADLLLGSVSHSGIRTSDMEKIVEINQIDLFSGVSERSDELKTLIAKIKKPEVKKLVEDHRGWIEQGVQSFKERDRFVADQILAQKGHGMVHVSRGLGPGVSDHLMDSCTQTKIK
jgi:hypothetical protein